MNQPLLQMDLRLVAAAVVVLAAAVSVIWWFGRRFRREMGLLHDGATTKGPPTPGTDGAPQVVKVLQQRGLVTPAQLAGMSETERKLLFSTMAGAIQEASAGETGHRGSGTRAVLRPDELPSLYCPICGYRIERFTSTPPITGQCETCAAKVIVRRDGGRILLTIVPREDAPARRTGARLEP